MQGQIPGEHATNCNSTNCTSKKRCCLHRFYFAYCEAAFDARYIHNFQVKWVKDAAAAPPPLSGPLPQPPAAPAAGLLGQKAAPHVALPYPTDVVTQARA